MPPIPLAPDADMDTDVDPDHGADSLEGGAGDEPLPSTLASPCVGVCRLDRVRQDCLGCRRTLTEIGAWRDLDDAARQRVLDAAAVRRAEMGGQRADAG